MPMTKWVWFVVAACVAACGHGSDVPPDAPIDAPPCPDCQLTAIEPALAGPGDTLTLEGTFTDRLAVQFPDGEIADAAVLGPHRATVTVPVTGMQGGLAVLAGSSRVGPLPFRRTSFPLVMNMFETALVEASQPRLAVSLATPSFGAASVVTSRAIYVLGGGGGGSADLDSVDRASINADGSLGTFSQVDGIRLQQARSFHASTVIGDRVYVTGGVGVPLVNGVEAATLQPDGSLGPFSFVNELMTTTRYAHTTAAIGPYLYLIGGSGPAGALDSIERATIAPDGSLGAFSPVAEAKLSIARTGHTSAVIGSYLYVVGGDGPTGPLASVERAAIQPDGSLGPFAAISSALSTARSGHTMAVVGAAVYVHGGLGAGGGVADVERAAIQPDGSLGPFGAVAEVGLTTARFAATSAIVGNYLYVLGGETSDAVAKPLASIERSNLIGDATLGEFALVQTAVPSPSTSALIAIDSYVYALGGRDPDTNTAHLNRVTRATVNPDGSLTRFAVVPDVQLVFGREGHSCAVIGDYLYVLGGTGANGVVPAERAVIHADGSLGPFAALGEPLVQRANHTSVLHRDSLYFFGGLMANDSATIDRVTIGADLSLGAPVLQSGVYQLHTQAAGNTSFVLGDSFYAIEGLGEDGLPQASAWRSIFLPDGTTTEFGLLSGTGYARAMHQSVVLGNQLVLFGGISALPGQQGVFPPLNAQQATLHPDGTLGEFSFFAPPALPFDAPQGSSPIVIGNYVYMFGLYTARAPIIAKPPASARARGVAGALPTSGTR